MGHQIKVGNLIVDWPARRVMLREQEIRLSRLEFDVLAYLVQQAGRVVTQDELLAQVWGCSQAEGGTLGQGLCQAAAAQTGRSPRLPGEADDGAWRGLAVRRRPRPGRFLTSSRVDPKLTRN
jgi:hypothetical protein